MTKIERSQTIRNIVIFTVLMSGLAWGGAQLGGTPTAPGLGLLVWGAAPIGAALIMKLILRDKVDMGWRPRLRGNGRWYLLSVLFFPAVMGSALAAGLLLGAAMVHPADWATLVSVVAPAAVIYTVFAFFEEVGWRGYLAPKMAGIDDRLGGHLLVGLIWASWHFPFLAQIVPGTTESMTTLAPRFVAGTVALAVVYGEIRLRTNSLWPAVLMHAVGNTIGNSALASLGATPLISLAPGLEWLASPGVEGVLVIVLCVVTGGALYVRRRRDNAAIDRLPTGQHGMAPAKRRTPAADPFAK